ncbi:DnaB-like helicase C-terminal domain-containing protein [Roseomonas sp. WA12]
MNKDASDLLQAGRVKDICIAVYEARAWRPGGVVAGTDLWDAMMNAAEPGRPYPYSFLNSTTDGLGGIYPGQLVMWVSGSGMGKSTLVREVAYADLVQGIPVADLRLEENVGQTGLGYVGIHLSRRLMLGGFDKGDPTIRAAFDETVGSGRFWTYDHFGSMEDGELLSKMRFMIKACGARTVVLDHISIVVSGMDAEGDERRTIDRLMTLLRSLVEETGVTLHAICHLKRVGGGGKSHEEGGRIALADLRGSQSIAQLSDVVLALERDQQSEDPETKDKAAVRSLKCRKTGVTGILGYVRFDTETGRMEETSAPEKKDNKNGGDDLPF